MGFNFNRKNHFVLQEEIQEGILSHVKQQAAIQIE